MPKSWRRASAKGMPPWASASAASSASIITPRAGWGSRRVATMSRAVGMARTMNRACQPMSPPSAPIPTAVAVDSGLALRWNVYTLGSCSGA